MPFRPLQQADPNATQTGFRPLQPSGQQPQDPFNLGGLSNESLVGTATQSIRALPGEDLNSPKFRRLIGEKKSANEILASRGLSPEQIQLSGRALSALDRPRFGRTIGGVVGGLAGAATFGPDPTDIITVPAVAGTVAKVLGATTAAGAGGVAGEAAQTAIEEKRLIGKREALKAFAVEAGTELGGRAAAGVGKAVFSPFIKQTVPEAAALVDDFAKVGGSFSPTELDNRFSLRIGEAFARGGFGAKEIFQEFEEKQGRAALAFADNIIESIGEGVARQPIEEIGEAFAGDITRPGGRVFNMLDDLFTPLYKQVDDIAVAEGQLGLRQARTGGPAVRGISGKFQPAREVRAVRLKPTVSTDSLKKFARKNLATDKRLNEQFLSPTGRSKLEKIITMKDKLTFSDMRTLRSSFLKDVQKMARDVDQSQGIIKQLSKLTDEAIFNPRSAQGLSPRALRLLDNTNDLYKASQEGLKTTFSEKTAKRLLKNPSSVVKELFPNNNPKATRLLRKSLVEPISGRPSSEGKILFNQLRQAWIADAVEQATKEGVVNPRAYNNILRKMGRKSFEEMFPEPEVRASVDKIQDLFSIAGKTAPTGASLFSRGAQTVGAVKLWQGARAGDVVSIGSGGLLSIGPLAFAKLATTPKGVKALTIGFKARPGTSAVVPAVTRMVRLLREIDKKEGKQRRKQERAIRSERFGKTTPSIEQLRGLSGRGF